MQYLRWEPWIFYHVVFWMFIPAAKPGFFQDLAKNGRYLIWHAVMALAFLLMTPITHNIAWAFDWSQMVRIFDIWGYVHITGSFALSVLNPRWIVKGFGLKMAEAAGHGIESSETLT